MRRYIKVKVVLKDKVIVGIINIQMILTSSCTIYVAFVATNDASIG
jgi:hypothetical protein